MNVYDLVFIQEVSDMSKGKRYDRNFQLEAARLVVDQGYTKAGVSRKLGVSAWSTGRWIKRFRDNGELNGHVTEEAVELRQLRKQIKELEVENEILKKAAAYFARESL
jgi:transposase